MTTDSTPRGWAYAECSVSEFDAYVPHDSFQQMTGDFTDWTLADCQWYHDQLNITFRVDGDALQVAMIQ